MEFGLFPIVTWPVYSGSNTILCGLLTNVHPLCTPTLEKKNNSFMHTYCMFMEPNLLYGTFWGCNWTCNFLSTIFTLGQPSWTLLCMCSRIFQSYIQSFKEKKALFVLPLTFCQNLDHLLVAFQNLPQKGEDQHITINIMTLNREHRSKRNQIWPFCRLCAGLN